MAQFNFACADYLMKRAGASDKEKNAFLLLYFMSGEHIAQGDTWLWFSGDVADAQGLQGYRWCTELIGRALSYVDLSLGQVFLEDNPEHDHLKDDIKRFVALLRDFYRFFADMSLGAWYEFLSGCFFCGEGRYFVLSPWQKDGFGLWLQRFWQAEMALCAHIKALMQTTTRPPVVSVDGLNVKQQAAVEIMLTNRFSIITGGPGTGKTYTIGRFMGQLLQDNPKLSLALAAPTGKAAQRMQSALIDAMPKDAPLPKAQTLHRLLGIGADGVPTHHTDWPLPYDVVVVDEASMLGVVLASQLIAAIKKDARLILLGDSQQLAAVEAGAVLDTLCRLPVMASRHVNLLDSRRFDDNSVVGQLAKVVSAPNTKEQKRTQVMALTKLQHKSVDATYKALIRAYEPYFKACRALLNKPLDNGLLSNLFATAHRYRVLTASHLGAMGDERINHSIALAHREYNKTHPSSFWYHGMLIMVTKNSYHLGLFNGDVGICLYVKGRYWLYFEGRGADEPMLASELSEHIFSRGYAITVHKSQGSEFTQVAVCFDDSHARLLSVELLYTAITRAKEQVDLFTSEQALMLALQEQSLRQTGLFYLMNERIIHGD